jgi:uncharacterized Zn-finger protein
MRRKGNDATNAHFVRGRFSQKAIWTLTKKFTVAISTSTVHNVQLHSQQSSGLIFTWRQDTEMRDPTCVRNAKELSRPQPTNLKRHSAVYEDSENRRYSCSFCGKRFTQHGSMRRHEKTAHLGERNFGCDQCPAIFAQNFQLRRHAAAHCNEDLHVCQKCGIFFTTILALKRHFAIHSAKWRLECTKCPAKLSTARQRAAHGRIRHGSSVTDEQSKHVCHVCNQTFKERNDLRSHLLQIHIGLNP